MLLLLALMACHGKDADAPTGDDSAVPAPITPESVAATAQDGDAITVRGTVHTLTFDSIMDGDTGDPDVEEGDGGGPWQRLTGRWLLFRSEVPEGIEHDELTAADISNDRILLTAWTLGVPLDDAAPRPHIDDEVEVSGTFRWSSWDDRPVPVIEDATVTVLTGDTPAAEGDACTRDDDCAELLVCDRATAKCAPPEEEDWGSLWRDVDGHCYSDADCPTGQVCDTSFVVPDSGDYSWRFDADHKLGASLCVPESDDPDVACPHVWSPRDLAGGRFAEGREVCVEGTVQLTTQAPDGDTHLQLMVDEPVPYPTMDAHVWLFGATTEIGPAYKNPDRPQGAVTDPAVGQHIRVIGTYRWDSSHGWFEVHPVKRWWEVEPSAR